jgi:hypothetical protein
MKRKIIFLLLVLLVAVSSAQIGMTLKSQHANYLRYEPIELTLELRNYSGNTLVFGKDDGSMTFRVRTRNGRSVASIARESNPMEGLVFAPGETRVLRLNINQLFDLQRPDYYAIDACVEHVRLPRVYVSNEIGFEVKGGALLLTKTFGLPTKSNTDKIRSATANLLRFNDGRNDIYCLRVEDDENVYGTFRIGPFIEGSTPQLDVDSTSSIHVLVQLRPRLYAYNVYAIIKGEAKLRQQRYYVPLEGTPTLSRVSGYLKILHARVAREGEDYQIDDD